MCMCSDSDTTRTRWKASEYKSIIKAPIPLPCVPFAPSSWHRRRLCWCVSLWRPSMRSSSSPKNVAFLLSFLFVSCLRRSSSKLQKTTIWRITRRRGLSTGLTFLFCALRCVSSRTRPSLSVSPFPPWTGRTSFASLWRRCR